MLTNRRMMLTSSMAAALALPRIVGAQAGDSVSIALDWYPNSNHAGLLWAKAKGLFAQSNLEVTLVVPADPTTVLQTVAAGRDTFGISYQPDILLARAEGLPIVAVAALVQRPLLGVMSLQSSGITRPAELAGKVVGYPGIPSQAAFLTTMLEFDGIALSDIELNNVEFNLLPALISGQAAAVMGAYWTHETIIAELEGYPVDLLRVEEWGVPSYNELVLVTTEQTILDQRQMVDDVVSSIRSGYLAAAGDQNKALELIAVEYPETDLEVETRGLALLANLWTDPEPGFGYLVPDQWSEFARWMIRKGLLPEDFSTEGIIDPNAIPAGQATPISWRPQLVVAG